MKTAVSIPDHLFEAADRLARQRKVSRSALYAEALELLLAAHDDQSSITVRLDEVYADSDSTLDGGLAGAQADALREAW